MTKKSFRSMSYLTDKRLLQYCRNRLDYPRGLGCLLSTTRLFGRRHENKDDLQLVGFQVQPKMALAQAATSVMTWNTWNGGDLFTTPFKADHSGEDAVLDSIMLTGGTAGLPLQMTDLAGVLLVEATGTSVAAGGYAPLTLPVAVSNALSQAMLYPTAQQIPAARTYAGTMSGASGSGVCSLTVSLSATSTPGTMAGTCASPATGAVALNGTVTSSGQAGFTNGAGLAFTGGVTAMGGAGTWVSGALSGTWTIH